MNIFFGKISDKIDANQYLNGFYETNNPSMFNGIEVRDYSFIIAGGKIRLWKAREWKKSKHRLEFDILIDDLNIKTRDLIALKFFQLETHYVIYPIRHAHHAFYKLTPINSFSEDDLQNVNIYRDENNYRKITIIKSANMINAMSDDIQLFYNNGKLELFRPTFFKNNFFKNFIDNTNNSGNGRVHKDKTLKKIKDAQTFPASFNRNEISILNLYDAFGVKYTSLSAVGDEESIEVNNLKSSNYGALNTILYGPPGTGKTYNSISKALEIIGIDSIGLSRQEIKEEYNRRVADGQIVFTTFHQSMSYEDFIEGIKPETEDGKINYDVKSGIFKMICDTAKSIKGKDLKVNWDKVDFYKMSLGGKDRPDIHEWCITNNLIALGWGGYSDLSKYTKYKTWQEYRDNFIKEFPEVFKESRFHIQATYTFQKMKIGDVVIISKGNRLIDAIGIIKGSYSYDDKNEFDFYHFRKVEWIAINLNTSPERFFNQKITQMTIYEFYKEDLKIDAFKELVIQNNIKPKPYILIIDEINRGNIPQIFGELITLIEEDKRIGNEESLEVILPYSKERFGVPSNLYIIGTMNTADRSVEALDTALRRRFSFEETAPKPELLSTEQIFGRLFDKFEEVDWDSETWQQIETNFIDFFEGRKLVTEVEYRKALGDQYIDEWLDIISSGKIIEFNGIKLDLILKTINQRLDILIDRDHKIGHSYFLNILSFTDLISIFENKIIPLLQEYFYNDFGKIGLVLGLGFINIKKDKATFAKSFLAHYENVSDYEEKTIYELAPVSSWTIQIFKDIYE